MFPVIPDPIGEPSTTVIPDPIGDQKRINNETNNIHPDSSGNDRMRQ